MTSHDGSDGGSGVRTDGGVAVDDNELLKSWTIGVVGILTSIAVGLVLFEFLADAVDQAVLSADQLPQGTEAPGFSETFGSLPTAAVFAPYLAVAVAGLLGVQVARVLDVDDGLVYKTLGASLVAGTLVAWFLGVLLGTNLVDGAIPDGMSLDYVGVLVNGILAGVAAAVAGAGSAWIVRNQTPIGLDVPVGSGSQVATSTGSVEAADASDET